MFYRTIDLKNSQDKEILIKFRKDTYEVGSETNTILDTVAYIQRMEARVSNFPDGQLLIEDGGKPIGQVGFDIQEYNGEDIGYVNLLYLIPEYRGKGIGKELIHYVENFFIKSKVSEYHLRVSSRNERAISLYSKIGMIKISEENDKLRMKKILVK